MLAERRNTNNTLYHVPKPTSKVVSFRVADDPVDPYWHERRQEQKHHNKQRQSSDDDGHTSTATRCEVRALPTKHPSVGCVLVHILGVSSVHELNQLIQRATTLPQPGLRGLLLDCRLDHVPNVIAYEEQEENKALSSNNATTPSKPSSSFPTTSVVLSICSSMSDIRKLYHSYRKRSPKVRVIVCGQVLTFHAREMMGYGEGRARGVTLPPLPTSLVGGGEERETDTDTDRNAATALGTGYYRASKETKDHTIDVDDANNPDNDTSTRNGWMTDKTDESTRMDDLLDNEQDYAQLSPIERALRVLGDDVLLVKQEFDQRTMNGSTVSAAQVCKIIGYLLDGAVPNVVEIVEHYRGEHLKGKEFSFSELIILYSDKFYFATLRQRHATMAREVGELRTTVVSIPGETGTEEVYDDDEEWDTIIRGETEKEKLEAARQKYQRELQQHPTTTRSDTLEVDMLVKSSIQEEGQHFADRVNAAFRRFDVYGVDLDALDRPGGQYYDEDDDAADQGFVMLDDAPDALVAVGLPIEREEAEHLIDDLSSGTSSDFRGFNLMEFRMVCARILNVFEGDGGDRGDRDGGGGGGGGGDESTRSRRK